MSLGFTVPELLPRGRGGGALQMGLVRLSEAAWLRRDHDATPRRDVFDAHPDAIAVMPEAEEACAELAEMADAESFEDAARSCWEDFCILRERGSEYVLTAGAVGFPTDWRLAEKMGRPLLAIHEPIHGYAEQLAPGVDHFFHTLKPGPIFGRTNWFVVASGDWRYLPMDDPSRRFAHVCADNAGKTLFVRCERQTLRRLPRTRAVAFTIAVAVEPLEQLPVPLIRRMADALGNQPGGEQDRRAAPFYAEALSGYAAAREQQGEFV